MGMRTATASRAKVRETNSGRHYGVNPFRASSWDSDLERPGRWRSSSKLMGAALPGAIRARDAATRCEPASPKGHRNQHVGLDPASAQPTTKLTDAAWHRMRPAVLDDRNPHSGRKSPEPAGSGCNPAIGQPFNISWGGRGNTT